MSAKKTLSSIRSNACNAMSFCLRVLREAGSQRVFPKQPRSRGLERKLGRKRTTVVPMLWVLCPFVGRDAAPKTAVVSRPGKTWRALCVASFDCTVVASRELATGTHRFVPIERLTLRETCRLFPWTHLSPFEKERLNRFTGQLAAR